jgi:hypothetical protein
MILVSRKGIFDLVCFGYSRKAEGHIAYDASIYLVMSSRVIRVLILSRGCKDWSKPVDTKTTATKKEKKAAALLLCSRWRRLICREPIRTDIIGQPVRK